MTQWRDALFAFPRGISSLVSWLVFESTLGSVELLLGHWFRSRAADSWHHVGDWVIEAMHSVVHAGRGEARGRAKGLHGMQVTRKPRNKVHMH